MSPDIFVDHVWLPDDDVTKGVQIVELKSSDSDRTDDKDCNVKHNWSHAQNAVDGYKVNEPARERRRMKNQNRTYIHDSTMNTDQYGDNFPYRDVYLSAASNMHQENVIYNHQMNCFTILDNHIMSSDTSDEDFADIELISCGEPMETWNYDDGDIISYDQDMENEKRTVWIYSFKNKRLLSDNDFDLVNIPSQEASTSTIEDCPERKVCSRAERAATPVPPPHVPRLHIPKSPTLPTVTEVSEPGKRCSSNQTDASKRLKPNNWFLSEHVTPTDEKVYKTDKAVSASVVNWMALSPREKRRRFRNASPITLPTDMISPLPTLKETSSLTEDNIETMKSCESLSAAKEEINTKEQLQSSNTPHSRRSVLEQLGSALDTARKSIKTFRTNMSTPKEPNNSGQDSEIESESRNQHEPQDRGDHKEFYIKAPRMKMSPNVVQKPISDPIEKLDSDDWIQEEKLVESGRVIVPDDARGDGGRAARALWNRNMTLLKPAQWAEYLPITESIPSLHLSIATEENSERAPWYRRLAKLFHCCK